jgi:alpha-beta hydrolase superfamily lysophospholipase
MTTPITSSLFSSELIETSSGAKLHVYSSLAQKPRGVVQINHGLAEHAARYQGFAAALSEAGYHAYAHDHRGHGQTTAVDAPAGMFAPEGGDQMVITDVEAVHNMIAARHAGLPVITFGHSMGGLIALNHAIQYPARLAGLAVWNSNFSAGALGRVAQGILAFERFRLGHDVPSRMLPKLTFAAWAKSISNHRTGFDWLSRDATEVDAYIADPLCGWDASVAMWQDVFKLVFAGADDTNLSKTPRQLPIHLHGGGHDPATDFGKATEALASRFQALGFKAVTTTIDPEGRHESLNEINRGQIIAEFIDWANHAVANWQRA